MWRYPRYIHVVCVFSGNTSFWAGLRLPQPLAPPLASQPSSRGRPKRINFSCSQPCCILAKDSSSSMKLGGFLLLVALLMLSSEVQELQAAVRPVKFLGESLQKAVHPSSSERFRKQNRRDQGLKG